MVYGNRRISFTVIAELKKNTHTSRLFVPWANLEPGTSPVPIPAAARSKAWVSGRSLNGDCGFESRQGAWMSVYCQVLVSATV